MEAIHQITLNPDVVYTRFDDTSAALLNLKTKRYYTLNETGARIWELLEERQDLTSILDVLRTEFEVDDARSCVEGFLEDLRGEELVTG